MVLSDRVLMGPGPCNPYPEATAGLTRPILGHLDPEFIALLDETCDRLRVVWATSNPLTLPVSGTGSAGMEATFVNLVGPGDTVVVGVNGLFGERMCDVASRCGAEVVRVDAPWGTPLDPQAVLDAHPSPKLVAAVHAETSTGVRNDIAALAAGKGDALLLADCVTSLGGIPVAVDEWGVDVAYSGTQKCLGVSPGLAPVTISPRAWERRIPKPQSWYLDLGMIGDYTSGATRKYHHTAPIAMIMSLHAALGALLEEGLDQVIARHAECGQALQDGLVKMGLELWAAEGSRLPELTTVVVPEGVDDAGIRRQLLDRYGIEIGGGAGPWAGKIWRIGCMGHTARMRNVTLLLAALAELLGAVSWSNANRPSSLVLTGRRLLLRPLVASDFEAWREVRTRGRDWLLKWEPRLLPGQPDATEDRRVFAARCGARERERQLGSGYGFGIFVGPEQDRFAGEINLSSIQRGPYQNAYVGYWIDEAVAGNSYVPEAFVVLCRFAFEDLYLHRLQASIIPRNRPSHRVAEKLGLRNEGTALRYLEINGRWEDHVRYAITSEDWQEKRDVYLRDWVLPNRR